MENVQSLSPSLSLLLTGRGKEITAAFRGLRDRERTLIPIGEFIAVDFCASIVVLLSLGVRKKKGGRRGNELDFRNFG